MTEKDPDALRMAMVRQLFRSGSYPRTGKGVLMFYGWLEQNCPDLLPSPKLGDSYEALKLDLYGLYTE